ncbi:GT4 family glycosyltransferase PelF [Actinacidiphila sp. bgisy160]|uniref:GT4 family glycosyltransferase PelF n=1 Tax=Actinacidiphila sp. bgisy160 TaxID=3413796 RepID=UPI003D7341ED
MRIALLAEGGYPYARGEGGAWVDRLVRGLTGHEFAVYALGRSERAEAAGMLPLPPQVRHVRTLPLWGQGPGPGAGPGKARRRRAQALERYRDLVGVLAGDAGANGAEDRFASALYGLAELAREDGGVPALLRSEHAVRVLEEVCRAPGARPVAGEAGVGDLLLAADQLERVLRPLSAPWYDDFGDALATSDLCHAVTGGTALLPALLAKRFFGTPLLVTEYGVRLRETLLLHRAAGVSAPVRALLAAFHRHLAGEAYRLAALVTPGNAHARRWQEHCGAHRDRVRTVYPGYQGSVPEPPADAEGDDPALVWVGRADPGKDLVGLLHAFGEVRKKEPGARLRVVLAGEGDPAYLEQCRSLAAQLFPDEAADAVTAGENPVTFEELGSPGAPALPDAYAAGDVVVLSSVVEGFPVTLVEAMFCGRATVSTDVGAVREVIGGTGLVVPPRNPKALAEACVALLCDPERRQRLGAAARERALELFTVERNLAAFREIYLDLVAHAPGRHAPLRDPDGIPVPFGRPAESHVPGRWTAAPAWALAAREPAYAGAERRERT